MRKRLSDYALVMACAISIGVARCEMQAENQEQHMGNAQASAAPVDEVDGDRGEGAVTVAFDPGVSDSGRYLSGEISRAGVTVWFEVVRGPAVPLDMTVIDPDAPSHEIDARLLGASGQPFAERIGGHGFIERAWANDTALEWTRTSDEDRRAQWEVVDAAIPVLSAVPLPVRLADLRAALVELIEGSLIPVVDDSSLEEHSLVDLPEGVLASVQTSAHIHFEIWWKDLFYPSLGLLGEHSATRSLNHLSNGSVVANSVRITCNHGTCAASGLMSSKISGGCPRVFLNRSAVLPSMANCGTTTASENYSSYSCCATAYGVAPNNGRHVCNDDSRKQKEMVAGILGGGEPAFCGDNDLRVWAPSCNTPGW